MNQHEIQHLIFDYRSPFLLNALRESEHKSKRLRESAGHRWQD